MMMTFDVSEKDIEEVVKNYVTSMEPFKLKVFPSKEKKKYILLRFMIKLFKEDIKYSEVEVNRILKPVYKDYVMIRRYLIDYGYLKRLDDGRAYWVNSNKKG